MREALLDIWLNRDYTLYGQVTKQGFESLQLVSLIQDAPVHPQGRSCQFMELWRQPSP